MSLASARKPKRFFARDSRGPNPPAAAPARRSMSAERTRPQLPGPEVICRSGSGFRAGRHGSGGKRRIPASGLRDCAAQSCDCVSAAKAIPCRTTSHGSGNFHPGTEPESRDSSVGRSLGELCGNPEGLGPESRSTGNRAPGEATCTEERGHRGRDDAAQGAVIARHLNDSSSRGFLTSLQRSELAPDQGFELLSRRVRESAQLHPFRRVILLFGF